MRTFSVILCGAAALLALTACGAPNDAADSAQTDAQSVNSTEPTSTQPDDRAQLTELTVFAAASLTESLNEIKTAYEAENPTVALIYNFDSSGTLQTQIEEGADCDLFLSAGQKQMDSLGAQIDADTRVDLLQNTVVMVTPKGAPAITFDTIADAQTIALGGADVPVGQYAQEILTQLGVWDELNAAGRITFGSNVKEVTAQVAAGAVDCGVVYRTDAASEPEIVVTDEAPANTYSPAVYPAAVLADAAHADAAQDFLDYLQSDDAMDVFTAVGFTRP